jgi:hypothetical protein
MTVKISMSAFFKQCGVPLRNSRWSWGAIEGKAILLRTWADQLKAQGKYVPVLSQPVELGGETSTGLAERIDHLRTLWGGGFAGYAVMATPVDDQASPRKIRNFDSEYVFAINSLIEDPNGSVWAELGERVPASRIAKHSKKHRVAANDNRFPRSLLPVQTSSGASYLKKLPSMREWLIRLARQGRTVTYKEAREPFELKTFEHRHAMDHIGNQCVAAGEPILTSLIVDEDTGRCSKGFYNEFRRNDVQERAECYAFWVAVNPAEPVGITQPASDIVEKIPRETLQAKAARFAQVATRPEQARFRRLVFMECKGRCIVTGCDVPEALDAAHREGRDWKEGHNLGSDGYLLRKDIHALYDRNLLKIEANGKIELHTVARKHYSALPAICVYL